MDRTVAGTETPQISRTYGSRLILFTGFATVVAIELCFNVSLYLIGLCGWQFPGYFLLYLIGGLGLFIVLYVFLLREIWGKWIKVRRTNAAKAMGLLLSFQPAVSVGCLIWLSIWLQLSPVKMHGYGYRDFLRRELDVRTSQAWLSTQDVMAGTLMELNPLEWPKCIRDLGPDVVYLFHAEEETAETVARLFFSWFEIVIGQRDMVLSPQREGTFVYTIAPGAYLHCNPK